MKNYILSFFLTAKISPYKLRVVMMQVYNQKENSQSIKPLRGTRKGKNVRNEDLPKRIKIHLYTHLYS